MKALLRYDWYVYRKRLLLFFGIYGGVMGLIFAGFHYPIDLAGEWHWMYKAILLVLFLPIDLFIGLLPAKALSDSMKSGWLKLSAAMPYTKQQLCGEKYLFGLLVIAAHGVCVAVCQVIAIAGSRDGWDIILLVISYELAKPLMVAGLSLLLTARWSLSAAVLILIGVCITVPHLLMGLVDILVRDNETVYQILYATESFLASATGGGVVLGLSALVFAVCCRRQTAASVTLNPCVRNVRR